MAARARACPRVDATHVGADSSARCLLAPPLSCPRPLSRKAPPRRQGGEARPAAHKGCMRSLSPRKVGACVRLLKPPTTCMPLRQVRGRPTTPLLHRPWAVQSHPTAAARAGLRPVPGWSHPAQPRSPPSQTLRRVAPCPATAAPRGTHQVAFRPVSAAPHCHSAPLPPLHTTARCPPPFGVASLMRRKSAPPPSPPPLHSGAFHATPDSARGVWPPSPLLHLRQRLPRPPGFPGALQSCCKGPRPCTTPPCAHLRNG